MLFRSFFTPEHLREEAEFFGEDPKKVNEKSAKQYHEHYKKIAQGATDQVEKSLKKSEGNVRLLTAREIAALRKEGTSVSEIKDEG